MFVDTHLHLIAPDRERYPRSANPGWDVERPLDAEGLLRRMDECGVDKAAVVQANTVHRFDNSYICDSAERWPDRLGAVCTIDMTAPDAPERLRYWLEDRGGVGLRLTAPAAVPNEEWLLAPDAEPAWETAQAMDVPVSVHVRRSAGLSYMRTMLERYPRLRFQLDHLAHPDLDGGPPYPDAEPLMSLAPYGNLSLKLTEHALKALTANAAGSDPFLRQLVDRYGANRIMWGSNIPRYEDDYPKSTRLLREAVASLEPQEAAWIMGETALSIYPKLRRAG
jgi:predicted TIM-barrel fold metal-dependent hydrolase